MELRAQAALTASVLCLAIAVTVLLRSRRPPVQRSFALFSLSTALWYLSTFIVGVTGAAELSQRLNLVCAVLLPLAGLRFFRVFVAEGDARMALLSRLALVVGVALVVLAFTSLHQHDAVQASIFLYVAVFLFAALALIFVRALRTHAPTERTRLRFLATVGILAAVFTLLDYLPYVGVEVPPIGTVLTVVFLYMLSQSILRHRLIDLYELAVRLGALTALATILASILWILVRLAGERFFLHSIVAALVVLLLFDPLRSRIEGRIPKFFFRGRYDLEQVMAEIRGRLAHSLELADAAHTIVVGLEASRRITHAAVYLADEDGHGYTLLAHAGPKPPARIEIAVARQLGERLVAEPVVVAEGLARERKERLDRGETAGVDELTQTLQTLEGLHAWLCAGIRGGRGGLYGLLCVDDDRHRDAFAPDEIPLFQGLAAQAAIAVENSRHYERLKERDRLAAMGEMAAGLAHEIRNPLGAIKASAQYLAEPGGEATASSNEFLAIIVEEVDRLNRVLSSFLDYARPASGNPAPTSVNTTVRRTMQLLGPACEAASVHGTLELDETVPPVRVDVEQLRQVLINLILNAIQAMPGGGDFAVATSCAERDDVFGEPTRWVEIRVKDTGPGIPERVRERLFTPFVTTKEKGTGLGLAVSHRVVRAVGGKIEVRSEAQGGTEFTVLLPVGAPALVAAAGDSATERPISSDRSR